MIPEVLAIEFTTFPIFAPMPNRERYFLFSALVLFILGFIFLAIGVPLILLYPLNTNTTHAK